MSRRRLSDDERVLWKGVTRSIAPLRKSLALEPDGAEPATAPSPPKPRAKPAPAIAAPVAPPKRVAPPAPSLAPLTRRTKKRIARGNHAIDGRLDLHGMTQAEAHDALFGFLRAKQVRGAKVVLVITGKGARGSDDGGGRGVLKRMVPMWLGMPDFRGLIVGFESAAVGHGGEGALYVSLRKARGD
jgi:DNA-nicking Smr family endonuclease